MKIGSSFYGFTADKWKVWTTIYSPIALKGILPDNHLRIWLLFVHDCSILCTRIINKNDTQSASLFKQFCLKFIDAYGHEYFTPNMHMHTHLEECCNDVVLFMVLFMGFGVLHLRGTMESLVLIKQTRGTLNFKNFCSNK